jgi:hypothetical protein
MIGVAAGRAGGKRSRSLNRRPNRNHSRGRTISVVDGRGVSRLRRSHRLRRNPNRSRNIVMGLREYAAARLRGQLRSHSRSMRNPEAIVVASQLPNAV